MSPRAVSLIVLLTAAAIGSWYLARIDRSAEVDAVPYDTEHRGYYLKSARILGTDADGSLLYEIEAAHAQQETRDRVEFTGVRVHYSPDAEIPWVVHADAATLREGSPRIALRGHVRAVGKSGDDDQDTEIRTQYLELDPERYVAETDERVQIRVGARSLTATGMLASLNDNTVELKSNVRGKIVP
ncbi:MAG: LPS export ABC transporter periplasmic protein LptC [Proteobacteria bacterium]|nr:LPS export ABC transporter periplasmic protein LptC [Pseudomonadota bacterium]